MRNRAIDRAALDPLNSRNGHIVGRMGTDSNDGADPENKHGIADLKARIATRFALYCGRSRCCSAATMSSRAQEPTAAGLWQKLDEDTKKPVIWFLFVDRGGVFEGYAAKLFPQPGENPNPACTHCTDDRKGAPMLGLPMIRGMKRAGLKYEGGTVLDPRDGKVYSAVMTLDPAKEHVDSARLYRV